MKNIFLLFLVQVFVSLTDLSLPYSLHPTFQASDSDPYFLPTLLPANSFLPISISSSSPIQLYLNSEFLVSYNSSFSTNLASFSSGFNILTVVDQDTVYDITIG